MDKKVLILHGWGGSDYPHWQSWLAGEIAKDYGCVNFLRFSHVDAPKLDIWLQELRNALEDFHPDIVVCHSLANTLWFHLCNTQSISQIQKLYLVAPPSLTCKVEELQEFFPLRVSQNLFAKKITLIGSTNDPYMEETELHKLQTTLNCELKILKHAGHINTQSGYGEWEWIYREIQKDFKTQA